MNTKAIAALALGTCLAGCASYYSPAAGVIDPEDFGEANRQTFTAMVVNPDPVYTEPMVTSAEQSSDAAQRYRDGQVIQPQGEDTTSIGGDD